MRLVRNYSRSSSAIINSVVGFICLVIPIFLQFISRQYFLEYLNVGYLGVQGTYTSLLGTLSLTELGLQTAIVYCLYQPIKDNNYDLINDIMNVMRIVYLWIGLVFLIFPFFISPFLSNILQGIEINNEIRLCLFTESCSSAFSYFLSYKRTLLFADQKEYVSKIIDLSCSIIFVIIQLYCLKEFRSFLLFSVINCIRVIVSNCIIQYVSKEIYPYYVKKKFSVDVFKRIWSYLKNIIFLRIASYVYTSTDNLVISVIIGTAQVGYLGNYTIITQRLTSVANSILVPIGPIIGNLLLDKDKDKNHLAFKVTSFIRTIISVSLIIPLYLILDDFIRWWIGNEYILSSYVKILLLADIYINLTYTACCEFIGASGLFCKDRNIGIIGAFINIIISIVLAYLVGIEGVLIGTIVSQIYFWVSRSYIAFKYSICVSKIELFKYWVCRVRDVIIIISVIFALSFIYSHIMIESILIKIIVCGILSFLIAIIVFGAIYFKSSEFKYISNNLKLKLCSL